MKKYIFSAIIIAEILSYLSFAYPPLSPWIFGLVSVAIIMATVYRPKYGVILVFAELILGSLGKMFALDLGGFSALGGHASSGDISIRMVLWMTLLLVWGAHFLRGYRTAFLHSRFFKPYLAFAIILLWGIIWGLARGHGIQNVFFDINNYFYFLLIFPIFSIARSKKILRKLFAVIQTSLVWIAVKTIALFYIFSHELFGLQDALYAWSRFSRLAEITNIDPSVLTSRIFMQSHIWIIFGIFLFLSLLMHSIRETNKKAEAAPLNDKKNNRTRPLRPITLSAILALLVAAILASFSRSFWVAGLATFAFMAMASFFLLKQSLRQIFQFIFVSAGMVVLAVGLTIGVANFPIPKGEMSASLLSSRAAKFSGEAAISSRYAQIKPLLSAIKKHPIIGSGFGASATYASQDPRVLKNNPDGLYTTTAFELGWLEIWLKLGLLGAGIYLYILFKIFRLGCQKMQNMPADAIGSYYIFGALAGLLAVIITHGFSPYLNHPLGIGIVMIMTAVVDRRS